MRTLILLLFIVVFAFAACHKDNQNGPSIQSEANGKWFESKVHLYQLNGSGGHSYDTTYLAPFTSNDYLQFNADSITVSADHYYYPNLPGYPKTPQAAQVGTATYRYSLTGNKYILIPYNDLVTPFDGGVSTDTLSSPVTNQILLHSVSYINDPAAAVVADWYYSR